MIAPGNAPGMAFTCEASISAGLILLHLPWPSSASLPSVQRETTLRVNPDVEARSAALRWGDHVGPSSVQTRSIALRQRGPDSKMQVTTPRQCRA